MRVALDTNILVYAVSGGDDARNATARALLRALPPSDVCLPAQVAGEFYNVVVRKLKRSPDAAIAMLGEWQEAFDIRPATQDDFSGAFRLARDHEFQVWDALIVNVAASDGCDLLLSEDMHEGFRYRGLTIVNPFSKPPHRQLKPLFDALPESP